MKEFFLILIILLISSCTGTQTQIDSYKSVDQNASNLNQVLQNTNSKAETVEDWYYCKDSLKRLDYEACLSNELKKLEKTLNLEYSKALKETQEYHTEKDVENLTLAQKNWQSYRELNCQAAEDIYGEGTDAVGSGLECYLRVTKERLDEVNYIYARK